MPAKGTSRSGRKVHGRAASRRRVTPEERAKAAADAKALSEARQAEAAQRRTQRAEKAARAAALTLPSQNLQAAGVKAAVAADGSFLWWTPRREVRVPSQEAALRAMGSGVFGRWARKAAEPTPQGLWAFLQLVPKDHTTQARWKLAPHHWEWQSAAFLHRELNIIAPIGHGKTEQLSYARTAWEIGCNVRLRHGLGSNTAEQAIRTTRAIRHLIESSDDYRRVFPHVLPGDVWTDRAFTVQRPNVGDRNPTVQAFGLHGALLGARLERAGLDDMDDLESTWTKDARHKAQEWTRTNVLSRLGEAGRLRSVQTAWHPEDHAHSFRALGMVTYVYRIRNPDGSYLWSAYWNADREARMRRLLGETASARMLDSRPRTGDLSRFQEEWLRVALANGLGRPTYRAVQADNGSGIFVGVDLSTGIEDGDLASFAVVLCDREGRRHLLTIESGRWNGPVILGKIREFAKRYPGATFVVENNAAQDYICQFAAEQVGNIFPYTTGRAKADPRFGIESLATEMANGRWYIPCSHLGPSLPLSYSADAEVTAFISECFDYLPGKHTGDRLMSVWFALEGIRRQFGAMAENVDLWQARR